MKENNELTGLEDKDLNQDDPIDNIPNRVEEPSIGYGHEYTYGDYLKFEFDYMVELIRGKIFKMSPAPTAFHQSAAGKLYLAIANYLKGRKCKVFFAPFDVVLPLPNRKKKESSTTVIQPDVCVLCDLSKLDPAGCYGAPDWIIEVLSPHTSKKDIQLKYEVYEEVGVKEYWVVFPNEKLVEVFHLRKNKYERIQTYTAEDIVQSFTFPELSIELSEVFDYGFEESGRRLIKGTYRRL